MPRGSSDIPILRLEVLQRFMESFMSPPNLILSGMFAATTSPSSTIRWESQRGGRGMTPFVAPGTPAPVTSPHGVAQHVAEVAYWKEKMPFDEEFLNNLRQPGTDAVYQSAEAKLARELAGLKNRSMRRKEWMFAQMLCNNGFSYQVKGGYRASVNYGIPSDHRITLASAYNWNNGGSKDILADIRDAKIALSQDCGGSIDYAICNSQVLKLLAADTTIRDILKRQAFMDQNLYTGNLNSLIGVNSKVIGSLLDIPNLVIYDEMYEVRAWLTGAVTGGSTTWVSLDDVSDFEADENIRFWDVSAGTYEDRVVLGVNIENGTVQINYPTTTSYKSGEDYVTQAKPFIPDDKFIMMASRVDGQAIAEYKQAPFGLNRNYGQFTDSYDEWDPEVTWIRVQDKGLPILFNRDAIYTIDVVTTAKQAETSTTTSSSTTTTTTA
jgi:hypothetical protein